MSKCDVACDFQRPEDCARALQTAQTTGASEPLANEPHSRCQDALLRDLRAALVAVRCASEILSSNSVFTMSLFLASYHPPRVRGERASHAWRCNAGARYSRTACRCAAS